MLGLTRLQLPADEPQSRHNKAIHLRLSNGLLQNTFEADIPVKRLESMNALLQSLGNAKVSRLYGDPVIGLCRVLSDEEQIRYFLVDQVVVTLDVFLVDIQAGSGSEKMLDLVRALNVLVWLQVMNWLKRTRILNLHFCTFSLKLDNRRQAP